MSLTYSDRNQSKATLKPSPSLIPNNLQCVGGTSLVFAHARQACIASLPHSASSQPLQVRRVESQYSDVIYTLQVCSHGDAAVIVIATEAGIQVWDRTAALLLHVWVLPDTVNSCATSTSFARGITTCIRSDGSPSIVVGTSSGSLHAIPFSNDLKFKSAVQLPAHHSCAISCLTSPEQGLLQGSSTPCVPGAGCLVSCDDRGTVAAWQVADSDAAHVLWSIAPEGTSHAVAVAVRDDIVVVARHEGLVQVYGLADGIVRVSIGAHARFLSAMALHPRADVIATVAEDSSIAVWQLPTHGAKASLLMSSLWLNALLTGVAFCGPAWSDIAVVAYDTDELHVYKASTPA